MEETEELGRLLQAICKMNVDVLKKTGENT